ncbi:hypothetical protein GCM10010347_58880 [Streptomyces cirratus]|uniref:Uncharacterized protein n=1 Tax=Streptomyces cirratus TaxID=68187 RepID=A0ABQ3F4Y0_9ACTN|nr:hypothetical protein GCM10010347_58880 [Streptomyces cirratus]
MRGAVRGTLYTCAEVRREGPITYPAMTERDFSVESRCEDSTSSSKRSGSYRTPTISHRAGPRALGDSVLFPDWHGGGHGLATPRPVAARSHLLRFLRRRLSRR